MSARSSYVFTAVRLAWVALREGRLSASPREWLIHLRNLKRSRRSDGDAAIGHRPPALSKEAVTAKKLRELEAFLASGDRITFRAATDPVVTRLTTVPTIGAITAVAFVATLDDVRRFADAHQLEAFLGLTPTEYSSGEQRRRGGISKTGNPRLRWLLVEAAWRLFRTTHPAAQPLRAWAERIAARRGRSIAAVALARRTCLDAEPLRFGGGRPRTVARGADGDRPGSSLRRHLRVAGLDRDRAPVDGRRRRDAGGGGTTAMQRDRDQQDGHGTRYTAES